MAVSCPILTRLSPGLILLGTKFGPLETTLIWDNMNGTTPGEKPLVEESVQYKNSYPARNEFSIDQNEF
jgi:hypothetical protein